MTSYMGGGGELPHPPKQNSEKSQAFQRARNFSTHLRVELGVCTKSAAPVGSGAGGVPTSRLSVVSTFSRTSLRFFMWCMTPSRWKYTEKMAGSFCMRMWAICRPPLPSCSPGTSAWWQCGCSMQMATIDAVACRWLAPYPVYTASFFLHVGKKKKNFFSTCKKSWQWRLGTRLADGYY